MANPLTELVSNYNFGKLFFQLIVGGIALLSFWIYLNLSDSKNKIKIVLEKKINNSRVFYKIVNGFIKVRDKDNGQKKLNIPSLKYWGEIPDSRYFSHDMKGLPILKGVLEDQDMINWVINDNNIYVNKDVIAKIPLKDKNNKEIYETVEAKDSDGNPIIIDKETGYKVMLSEDKTKYLFFNDKGDIVETHEIDEKRTFIPKTEKVLKTKEETKVVRVISPHDQVIESDVKLYFMNKSQELRQKYKKKDQNEWLKQAAALTVMLLMCLAAMYMSYKFMSESLDKSLDRFETSADKYTNMFEKMTGISKSSQPSSQDKGQKVDNPNTS